MRQSVLIKGFTLIELIVVVAILAILAAIAVPMFTNVADRVKQGTDIASATEIANAINLYNHENPTTPITQTEVDDWYTQTDVISKLGERAPKLAPDNFAAAIDRIILDTNGIATVSTVIN